MSKPTIAILGASTDRSKYGNKSVRAHVAAGYEVFPINPKGGQIEGLTAYQSLAELPVDDLHTISVYLPPHIGIQMLEEIREIRYQYLYFNPGSSSPELIAQARELGLEPLEACSIVANGMSPAQFPDG